MESVLAFELEADELQVFRDDVAELLQLMETGILRLEQSSDGDAINSVFRAAHTLKAMAGTVGHKTMADVTHTMEFIFDAMRQGRLSPTRKVIDELLSTIDVIKALRDEVVTNEPSEVDYGAALERLRAVKEGCQAEPPALTDSLPEQISLSGAQIAQAWRLREEGLTILGIRARAVPGAAAPAARLLQAAMALMELGQVIVQRPTQPDLTSNSHRGYLEAVVAMQSGVEVVERRLGDIHDLTLVRVWEYPLETVPPTPGPANAPGENVPPPRPQPDMAVADGEATVRINVDRLDVLMNLVGELVTERSRLSRITSTLRDQYGRDGVASELGQMSSHFNRVVDQLQEEVMGFRMVPISHLFDRFPRLLRDLARSQGKEVQLVVEGEGTELDRSLIEGVGDPLIHLLRNAVDHGVETPDERVDAGKPATATVKLTAGHAEGHVFIEVADDGRGIDPEQVRRAAVRRRLLSQDQANQLSDTEAVNLVFKPGLSTVDKITEISGRGVGMDVVRSKVERLSGSVELDSRVGTGTTVRLSLPLTLAILQAMLVDVGGNVYAIPLTGIIESLYLSEAAVGSIKGNPVIGWRDSALPLLDLRRLFARGTLEPTSRNGDRPAVVTVAWGNFQLGLVVNRLIGKREVVVKSLNPIVGEVPGLSGCAILGDGRIALIIDIPGLTNSAFGARRQEGR